MRVRALVAAIGMAPAVISVASGILYDPDLAN